MRVAWERERLHLTPTSLDNGERSPRKLLRAVVARLLRPKKVSRQPGKPDHPRPLTAEERNVLSFLLGADFPGVEELREQVNVAVVDWRCPCGCASFEVSVDTKAAGPADSYEPIPVEAQSREIGPNGPFQLLLWVREGWLDGVEIVYFANEVPVEFPPLETFEPPFANPQT